MFQSTLAPEGASDDRAIAALEQALVSIHARTRGCERLGSGTTAAVSLQFQSTLAPEGASDARHTG